MGKEFMWICGLAGAGKTFLGDYLETRGWHHIDGDMGNQTTDPEVKAKWEKLFQAFVDSREGKVEDSDWQPYFQHVTDQAIKAQETNDRVVVSFAPLGQFDEKPFIDERLAGCRYVKVCVEHKELWERFMSRDAIFLAKSGLTHEKIWAMDVCKKTREKFGEEFSEEVYQMGIEDAYFKMKFMDFTGVPNCFELDNNDLASGTAIKQLNKLVGLEDQDKIDTEAIAAINYKRMENIKVKWLSVTF